MKIIEKIKLILVAASFAFMCLSCEKEATENHSKGFSEQIKNFVPDSTIQTLQMMGMAIHEGKRPPILEGTFLASPYIMLSSNVPDEKNEPGTKFIDQQFVYSDQNNDSLTIKTTRRGINAWGNIVSDSKGKGAFISGYNSSFSIFSIQEGVTYLSSGDTAYHRILDVVSGIMTPEGIKNLQSAILMLDDFGDPFDYYIPVNSGRVFQDADSISPISFNEERLSLPVKGNVFDSEKNILAN